MLVTDTNTCASHPLSAVFATSVVVAGAGYGGIAWATALQQAVPDGWGQVLTGTVGAVTVLGAIVIAFVRGDIYPRSTVTAYKDQVDKILPATERIAATLDEIVVHQRQQEATLQRMESASRPPASRSPTDREVP